MSDPLTMIEQKFAAKRAQILDRYLALLDDWSESAGHTRAVLDGRISQLDLDLMVVRAALGADAASTREETA